MGWKISTVFSAPRNEWVWVGHAGASFPYLNLLNVVEICYWGIHQNSSGEFVRIDAIIGPILHEDEDEFHWFSLKMA